MSILLGLVLLLGLSYAWFTLTLTGTKQNVIKVGKLSLTLTEGEALTLENAIPMVDEVALLEKPYQFSIANDGNVDSEFQVFLDNSVASPKLNCVLKKNGKILFYDRVIDLIKVTDINKRILDRGIIEAGTTNEYELYIWIDDTTTTATKNVDYETTISIKGDQLKERSLMNALQTTINSCTEGTTYCVINDDGDEHHVTHPSMSPYIWYSGKLWRVVSYNDEEEVKVITASPQTTLPWGNSATFTQSNVYTWINDTSSTGFLGNLYNYNDFLVTDYEWNYSPNTSTNHDFYAILGTTNIVTGPVGLLNTYDVAMGWADITYPTSNLLLNTKLGDYYLGNVFSNDERNIVTSPQSISVNGGYASVSEAYSNISPSVVFKNSVKVIAGSGTEDDPYILKGDQRKEGDLLNTAVAGEYVSFGDNYHSMYRLVGVQNGKPQLVSYFPFTLIVDEGSNRYIDLTDVDFSYDFDLPYTRTDNYNSFQPNSTDYPIAYYLNHDFLKQLNGYFTADDLTMMEKDQTFSLPTLRVGESMSSASITNVTTTVGFLKATDALTLSDPPSRRILKGETGGYLFHTFFTSDGTGLVLSGTTNSNGGVASVSLSQYSNASYFPSFFLKSNVKIKSGRGTVYDPYILTME